MIVCFTCDHKSRSSWITLRLFKMFPYILVLVPVSFFVSMLKPNWMKINLDLRQILIHLQQKVHKIEHLEYFPIQPRSVECRCKSTFWSPTRTRFHFLNSQVSKKLTPQVSSWFSTTKGIDCEKMTRDWADLTSSAFKPLMPDDKEYFRFPFPVCSTFNISLPVWADITKRSETKF